jgi:hypothetical protein
MSDDNGPQWDKMFDKNGFALNGKALDAMHHALYGKLPGKGRKLKGGRGVDKKYNKTPAEWSRLSKDEKNAIAAVKKFFRGK